MACSAICPTVLCCALPRSTLRTTDANLITANSDGAGVWLHFRAVILIAVSVFTQCVQSSVVWRSRNSGSNQNACINFALIFSLQLQSRFMVLLLLLLKLVTVWCFSFASFFALCFVQLNQLIERKKRGRYECAEAEAESPEEDNGTTREWVFAVFCVVLWVNENIYWRRSPLSLSLSFVLYLGKT